MDPIYYVQNIMHLYLVILWHSYTNKSYNITEDHKKYSFTCYLFGPLSKLQKCPS